MARLFIPWRLFFVLLSNEPATQRHQWLRWWMFRDRGVELVPPVLMPEGKIPPGIPLSARSKQEHAVLAALAEGKGPTVLNSPR